MKIGIIGAGNIGGALARRCTGLGHEVAIANSRGADTLGEVAQQTGATAVTAEEAPREAKLVIVTIPMKNVTSLPRDLLSSLGGTVVVDTCNYYPRQRDGLIGEIEDGMPESRWVEAQIGHPVIKVFNNIFAEHLITHGLPAGSQGRIALPVAGDDDDTKGIVRDLVEDLGFDAVDAGSLDDSWRQQPGTPVYGTDLDREGVERALADASAERPAEFRAD
jgi:hypothetical protein